MSPPNRPEKGGELSVGFAGVLPEALKVPKVNLGASAALVAKNPPVLKPAKLFVGLAGDPSSVVESVAVDAPNLMGIFYFHVLSPARLELMSKCRIASKFEWCTGRIDLVLNSVAICIVFNALKQASYKRIVASKMVDYNLIKHKT